MKYTNENHSDKEMTAAGLVFEKSFLSVSLEQQIQHCDQYEIVDLFKKFLPGHQPILEAGCGSGRWVAWFTKKGWEFYQYHFTKRQMRAFFVDAKFEILDEFVKFIDEGILHNFGSIAGTFDYKQGKVLLSRTGRILRKVCPGSPTGHMLCYILMER